MKLLLSIKPEFALRIFAGEKTYEFRKAVHQQPGVSVAAVYASKPIGMIIGEFEILGILSATPEALWEETRHGAGISRDFFFEYFNDRRVAYALKVGAVRRFEAPIEPRRVIDDFTPPQSYMYVSDQLGRVNREHASPEPPLPLFDWGGRLTA
jgi:predicted transcriptional regulator